ncbi:hypothetical protein ABC347_07800 [Sphingomonas sp. 1P06PA]|uniref:hypothetical protein n=1 Tax=Sphingomonas sp. 1P06PA TaxID=554121 RepID=UPI0039A5579C
MPRYVYAAAGLNPPIAFQAVTSGTEYSFMKKWFALPEACDHGYFIFCDKALNGAGANVHVAPGNTAQDWRVMTVEAVAGGAITQVQHPDNGNPIGPGNVWTRPANSIRAVRVGALAAGEYLWRGHDYVPVGGQRTISVAPSSGMVTGETSGASATPFDGTIPTGRVFSHTTAPSAFLAVLKTGKAVLVLGDSIEDRFSDSSNNNYNHGPIRELLTLASNGGRVAVSGDCLSQSNLSTFLTTPLATYMNGAQFQEAVLAAIPGANQNYWPFTDAINEHFRNMSGTAATVTNAFIDLIWAKDPTVRIWGHTPYPYVQGTGISGTTPATQFAVTADMQAVIPQGVAERDTFMTQTRSLLGGRYRGVFDHDVNLAPASPNQRLWKVGPTATMAVATIDDANGPSTITLTGVQPLKGEYYVIDPGGANQEGPFRTSVANAATPSGGNWVVGNQSNVKIVKAHPIGTPVVFIETADGTHPTARYRFEVMNAPGMIAAKQALIAA